MTHIRNHPAFWLAVAFFAWFALVCLIVGRGD